MEKFYNKDLKEIYDYFNSSEQGLTNKQIKINEKKYGKNILKEKKQNSILKVFI